MKKKSKLGKINKIQEKFFLVLLFESLTWFNF